MKQLSLITMRDIRSDFSFLSQYINGKPLIYLDSAATTQKPESVLQAMQEFYAAHYGPVHRSSYQLAEQATEKYEHARKTVAHFINAAPAEIVFTSGTTASLNMVALCWAAHNLHAGDEILLSELEHHSNLVPWQELAQRMNLVLKFIPVKSDGTFELENLTRLLTERTKLVSVVHVSHVTGAYTDLYTIIARAREMGARVCVDAAQSVVHRKLDVRVLDCDFLAFSGHKMFGPTGIGVLYIRSLLHDQLHPVFFGGGMIRQAEYTTSTYLGMPQLLEAGTPPVAQAIGLAAAIEYIQTTIDYNELKKHEADLCAQLIDGLQKMKGVRMLGNIQELKEEGHLVSFVVEGIHPHDVAAYADADGICIRAGTHCAQPLAQKLGVLGSVRASVAAYSTADDIAQLIASIAKLR